MNPSQPQFPQRGNNQTFLIETPGPSNIHINNMAGGHVTFNFNFQAPRGQHQDMNTTRPGNMTSTPIPRQNRQVVGFNASPIGSSSPQSLNNSTLCRFCSLPIPTDSTFQNPGGSPPNCKCQ